MLFRSSISCSPKEEHVEKMIGLFENAGLVLRNDLTFFMFMNSMKDRRFNSCAFLGEQDIDLKFENIWIIIQKIASISNEDESCSFSNSLNDAFRCDLFPYSPCQI